jgi:hypothetical protein
VANLGGKRDRKGKGDQGDYDYGDDCDDRHLFLPSRVVMRPQYPLCAS